MTAAMPGIATRLVERRKAAGLTQPTLADAIGVHEMTVSRWERGITEPCATHLDALAGALGCTTDYLLGRVSGSFGPPADYCLLCCESGYAHLPGCGNDLASRTPTTWTDERATYDIHGLCPGGPIPEGGTCDQCNMSWQTLRRLVGLQKSVAAMYVEHQKACRLTREANDRLLRSVPWAGGRRDG